MALPIKANNTQEGCNPISSNCVIWQGPDIPCINLCKGDTVSDVTAKLAERLCVILDYLKVSAYDLSCFNPVCPSPKDFQELIQLLVDRICAINNIVTGSGGSGGGAIGCPDCIVPVATCLQRPDALGNITATLQLKDYVILIGNEICTITTSITSIDSRVTNLETTVTDIQNNCCTGTGGGGADILVPAAVCIGTGADTPIIDFVVALESAFCALQTSVGTSNDINTMISSMCLSGSDQSVSGSTYNQLGWIAPNTLTASVQDLWVVICDLRTSVINLQNQLDECCNAPVTCSINLTGSAVLKTNSGKYYLQVNFAGGPLPAGWYFCDTGSSYTITGTNGITTASIPVNGGASPGITNIQYPTWNTTNFGDASLPEDVLYSTSYSMTVNACYTNGTDICNQIITISNITGILTCPPTSMAYNGGAQTLITRVYPGTGYPFDLPTSGVANTVYTILVYLNNNVAPIDAADFINPISGQDLTWTFTDLAPGSYTMRVSITQGTSVVTCPLTSNVVVPPQS